MTLHFSLSLYFMALAFPSLYLICLRYFLPFLAHAETVLAAIPMLLMALISINTHNSVLPLYLLYESRLYLYSYTAYHFPSFFPSVWNSLIRLILAAPEKFILSPSFPLQAVANLAAHIWKVALASPGTASNPAHKRNSELINSLLGINKFMNEAGRRWFLCLND